MSSWLIRTSITSPPGESRLSMRPRHYRRHDRLGMSILGMGGHGSPRCGPVHLGAQVVGIGMAEPIEDVQGVTPRRAGPFGLAGRVMGVAEGSRHVGFVV